MMNRTIREESFDTAGEAAKDAAKALECVLARTLGGQVTRTIGDGAIERVVDDEPPIDHAGQAVAQPLLAQLGKQEPQIVIAS